MNKSFNIFLFLLFVPTLVFGIVVGFDATLPFLTISGANIAHNEVYFSLLGGGMMLVHVLRGMKRWMAMRTVNQRSNFKWNSEVSRQRIQRIYTYNLLEMLLMCCAGISLLLIARQAWFPSIALLIGAIDALLFAVFGDKKHRFRTGITNKALIMADRDVIVIDFNGLRRISFQQQTLFFDFKGQELQLRLPIDCIPQEKISDFFAVLKTCLNTKRVYFSGDLPK